MALRPIITRRRAKRAGLAALALFAAAHFYALALGVLPAPRTWTMTGRVMAGETLQRQNIKITEVSPYLLAAVIAAEDARFCSHNGIDGKAIEKAIEHNKKGGRRRGGSTITQQTAKNLFFWNGGGITRKAGEAYAALFIDALWSKETILQHYLNVAEWGDGIFGAEAAAQLRFNKPASALTSYEAALLASVLPSPNKWRLDPPSDFVSGRARTINARLKVTAREGYGDCVLLNHPGYERKNFGVPPQNLAVIDKDTTTKKSETADESEQAAQDSALPLEDVLQAAETAARTARSEANIDQGEPLSADETELSPRTPTQPPLQDSKMPQISSSVMPTDIRPPTLEPETVLPADTKEPQDGE